jgi:hypothetical protein
MEAPLASCDFVGTTPFKVQVNFDIPLFEGKIDAKALERWLNVLEGYFFVHKFFNSEKITLHSQRPFPMSNIGRILTVCNMWGMILNCIPQNLHGGISFMPSRRSSYLLEIMKTCT